MTSKESSVTLHHFKSYDLNRQKPMSCQQSRKKTRAEHLQCKKIRRWFRKEKACQYQIVLQTEEWEGSGLFTESGKMWAIGHPDKAVTVTWVCRKLGSVGQRSARDRAEEKNAAIRQNLALGTQREKRQGSLKRKGVHQGRGLAYLWCFSHYGLCTLHDHLDSGTLGTDHSGVKGSWGVG